jgi:exodeoxyribonuclease VII small subunit
MPAKKKDHKTLEDLIARLEDISAKIQDGELGLEESIALYEEGQRIAKECHDRLSAAQKKLEVITPALPSSGDLNTNDIDDDDSDDDNPDDDDSDDPHQKPFLA